MFFEEDCKVRSVDSESEHVLVKKEEKKRKQFCRPYYHNYLDDTNY